MAHTGGVFKLEWEEEQISVRLDRLAEDSKHTVTGEITISSSVPGHRGHLHQARLNLTSTSARRTLATYLNSRAQGGDWDGIVEQACVRVLEGYREGEPLVHLANHPAPESLQYRVGNLIQEKQASLFFGEGDSGKSLLSQYLAVLVATGTNHNGFTPEPGPVLLLDWETDEDTAWERLNMITGGMGIPIPENIYYRYCSGTLASDIETIHRHCLDKGIQFVIVDSAAPAVSEVESSDMTSAYFRALRSLRVTTLTIAHVAKFGKDNEPFGSIFWRNMPRANFRVNSARDPGDPRFVLGIKHTKSNNAQRLRDIGLEMEFADGNVTFKRVDIADHPDLSGTLPLLERITASLKDGAKNVKDIAEMLQVSENSVRGTINRKKDLFRSVALVDGHGWGLRYKQDV